MLSQIKLNKVYATALVACSLMLSSCLGDLSDIRVLYNLPDTETVYTTATLSPEIEFPDGMPAQNSVEIRINGIDVTAEFDKWNLGASTCGATGTETCANKAAISMTIDNYPTMLAALREGTNTLQVTDPFKELHYFTVDLQGAYLHVTEVIDGYCGTVHIDRVATATDVNDGDGIEDFDCSDYYWIKCQHDMNMDLSQVPTNPACPGNPNLGGYDNLCNKVYLSILGSDCLDLNDDNTRNNSNGYVGDSGWSLTKGTGKYLYIRGFFENESLVTNMRIVSSNINSSNGAWSAAFDNTFTRGTFNYGLANNVKYAFGVDNATCNGVSGINLDPNEFCITYPDRDGLSLYVDGVIANEFLRSDIGIKDSELGNDGILAVRVDEDALDAFFTAISESLAQPGVDQAPPNTYIMDPGSNPPGECIGCATMGISLDTLYINALTVDPRLSTTNGRLLIDAIMDDGSGSGLEISGGIDISCHSYGSFYDDCYDDCCDYWGCAVPCGVSCAAQAAVLVTGCDLFLDGAVDGFTFTSDVDIDLYVDIWADNGNYNAYNNTVITSFVLTGQNVDLDGDLSFLVTPIANFIIGAQFIQDIVGDIIDTAILDLINTVFNRDLPLLRMAMPSFDTGGIAQTVYMSLTPEISTLTTTQDSADADMSLELELGIHATGKPRLNQSTGTGYDSLTPPSLAPVNNATINDHTMGLVIHQAVLNQIFTGMWESGIIYLDFGTGDQPTVNTFLNDGRVTFASAAPATLDLLPSSDPKGDLLINADDLLVRFQGDIYDPFTGTWEQDKVFFNLVMSFEVYASFGVSASERALQLNFESSPTIELIDFYSDYIPTDFELGETLLAQLIPQLVLVLDGAELDLGTIAGVDIAVKDVWVYNTNNLAIAVDASYVP